MARPDHATDWVDRIASLLRLAVPVGRPTTPVFARDAGFGEHVVSRSAKVCLISFESGLWRRHL